ncbi:putative peptidase-like protein [Sinorhizobium phage phiM7]|uniref:Putative peptidase-like protein n=3 Tax=Emdodecavirus TaxID=1980937 RepID=S5MB51_9CAUD|nr:putative peptidase-like protein [Sinorhizobium phage phiM12]YP_009212408.1 putative peptidase-like protein [Sinorhizobium phage phiN3]YP_009601281.1 putative peptidase-like protein [Sinorhizobium phage phiM7]AKF13061.1 peptidase-like protein [Sinorhizobium phage phiM19]AGR47858.1 putative peptidase-like protein [Sinorhizobium phage phiM12]AKF12702.1 putative peptidase-like protein [Sinorhizobium phage phiM7]AKF13431.1 putative peptidase-like protein [Sinorhizobium phage phiN3]
MHTYLVDILDVPDAEAAAGKWFGEFPLITVHGDNLHITLDIDFGRPSPTVKFFASLFKVTEEQIQMRVLKRF